MAAVKLIVMYPMPKDVQAFERLYQDEHVPMAVKKLGGKTKLVATKGQGSPQGKPAFYRISGGPFSSLQALQAWAAAAGGEGTIGHPAENSSGGAPILLVSGE